MELSKREKSKKYSAAKKKKDKYRRRQTSCDCLGYKCGMPNRSPRVIGGSPTEESEYPWLAYLTYRGKLYCGASLVNNEFLITAGHCIKGVNEKRVEILIGNYNKTDTGERAREVRRVKEWWHHPGFNRQTFNNDIGVIRIDEPIHISARSLPVCLPESDISYVGKKGIVAGWGRQTEKGNSSDIPREIRVPIMSNDDCRSTKYKAHEITGNMMCAGYAQGKIDACQGDSGGPLLYETLNSSNQPQIEMIGIVSWGQGCARPGYPGVYTRIYKYLNFLYNIIGCSCPRD